MDNAQNTRKILALGPGISAGTLLGVRDGMEMHQLSPGLEQNGQFNVNHDLSLIGQIDADSIERMLRDEDDPVFVRGDDGNDTLWLLLPASSPISLRVALAGSTSSYPVENLDQPTEWFRNYGNYLTGIRGALGWQPTFLVPPREWHLFARVQKCQRLYQAFGSWRASIDRIFKEDRETIDQKFARIHIANRRRDRQQRGNRKRSHETDDRRKELLIIAQGLWTQVLAQARGQKGRPAHRSQLDLLLRKKGQAPSRRDLDWLMKELKKGCRT